MKERTYTLDEVEEFLAKDFEGFDDLDDICKHKKEYAEKDGHQGTSCITKAEAR